MKKRSNFETAAKVFYKRMACLIHLTLKPVTCASWLYSNPLVEGSRLTYTNLYKFRLTADTNLEERVLEKFTFFVY